MKLWDVHRVALDVSGRASSAQKLADCMPHASGVFSLHELGGQIVTGSKDSTVALTAVTEAGLTTTAHYQTDLGVVKCARWRDPALLACTGNAGDVVLVDMRCATAAATVSPLVGATHTRGAYCVRWSPLDDNQLLSADRTELRLHDLRAIGRPPMLSLRGHSKPVGQGNPIFTPSYSHGGATITTLGAGSEDLTVYSALDGRRLNSGQLSSRIGVKGGNVLAVPSACPGVPEVLLLTSGKVFETYVPRQPA